MADIIKRPLPKTGFAPPFPAKAMNVNADDQAWVDAKMTGAADQHLSAADDDVRRLQEDPEEDLCCAPASTIRLFQTRV